MAKHASLAQHLRGAGLEDTFVLETGESLEIDDAAFDVVLSAFAIGHIANPDMAIREIFRVLRPGGRLLLTVGSRPPLFSADTVKHGFQELVRRVKSRQGKRVGPGRL